MLLQENDSYLNNDTIIEESEQFIKEFDEWFANMKIELERRGEIIDKYSNSSGFSYISDIYGK